MRDVYIVLREKEDAIQRVRREVEALRSATPLLADARSNTLQVRKDGGTETAGRLAEALRIAAPLLVDHTGEIDPEIRARLVEASESDFHLSRAKRISRQLRHLAMPLLGASLG